MQIARVLILYIDHHVSIVVVVVAADFANLVFAVEVTAPAIDVLAPCAVHHCWFVATKTSLRITRKEIDRKKMMKMTTMQMLVAYWMK